MHGIIQEVFAPGSETVSQHLSCHQVLPQYHGAGVVAAAAGRGTSCSCSFASSCITSALETSTYMGYMAFIGPVYGTMAYTMVIFFIPIFLNNLPTLVGDI